MRSDEIVKSLLVRHPGESRGPDALPAKAGNHKYMNLDSGFRRNDEFYGISTFYELIRSLHDRKKA